MKKYIFKNRASELWRLHILFTVSSRTKCNEDPGSMVKIFIL